MPGLLPGGLPHSDTPGSMAICAYPGFFAAYRVLHRLREPRHPPPALLYFLRSNPSLTCRQVTLHTGRLAEYFQFALLLFYSICIPQHVKDLFALSWRHGIFTQVKNHNYGQRGE